MASSVKTISDKVTLDSEDRRRRESTARYVEIARHSILDKLTHIGIDTEHLASLNTQELVGLLANLDEIMVSYMPKAGRPRGRVNDSVNLSSSDKRILLRLLSNGGHVSSLVLSRELGIPVSTVQRRKRRLESNLIERVYTIRSDKFGWRSATLYITIANRSADLIGKQILESSDLVTSVVRTLGGSSIDLKVEAFFKSNLDLIALIDRVKGFEGVTNVTWSENVQVLGRNGSPAQKLIDES